MKIIINSIASIGSGGISMFVGITNILKSLTNLVVQIGESFILLLKAFSNFVYIKKDIKEVVKQMYAIGVTSLPLVFGISIFTGAITTWQAKYQFSNIVPMRYLGTAVCKSITMELGPILTSLVVAARVGASLAAEIGTMKTNEQIDAMECLALNPVRFLIMPRILAGIVMLPVLVSIANFVAIVGAWFVAILFMNVTSHMFTSGLKIFFSQRDVYVGLIKSGAFGAIIAIMGCYNGLKSKGGAKGVGEATTKAVVSASVLILVFDYIIASIFF